jgi:hypothetical protein
MSNREITAHTAIEVGSISAVENSKKTCRKNDTIDVAAVKATNTIITSQDLNSLRSVQAEQPGEKNKTQGRGRGQEKTDSSLTGPNSAPRDIIRRARMR